MKKLFIAVVICSFSENKEKVPRILCNEAFCPARRDLARPGKFAQEVGGKTKKPPHWGGLRL
ncbi:MAG: hypothetical protein AAFR61_29405, partial [Bacteroidota bacterium]